MFVSGPRLETVWGGATRKLRADPAFRPVVERVGTVRMPASSEPPFVYLVRCIVFQQLAGNAARTIHGRLIDALGGDVSPRRVLRLSDDQLRSAGLSGAKLAAIRDLAEKSRSGEVRLDDLESLSDEDVLARVTRVRGIGPWTAHMFLMFRLRRPDVWPAGDFGVRKGLARLLGSEEVPSQKEMGPLGDAYRPWRSAAAWYCWRALEIELPQIG
jgi:DNA-3-methyladenine glycosylase II